MKTFKQIFALISILIICSSGKIDRGFKALKGYDYFKAKTLFIKSLKKNQVAASYGLSIIYGRKDNPFYNLDSAYKYVLLADTSFLKLESKQIKRLKKSAIDSEMISTWKDSIDYKVFLKAKRSNSLQSYNDFLVRHTSKTLNPIVTYKRDSIAFSNAKSSNSSASYASFTSKYPNSVFAKEAENRYEERLFFQVVELNNSTEYQSFIKTYPNSPFNFQAQDSLYKMQTVANNIPSYENFIDRYPRNRNVNRAWRLIYKLYTADFKPEKIVDFRLKYPEYPFLNELKTDFELATKEFYPSKRDKKWGFKDEKGNVMIDFIYDFVEPFSNGVALVIKNNSIGFINKSGETVIPFEYSEGESFQSGLAIVAKGNQFGIIDKTNSIVLPFQYVEIGNLNSELILIANEEAYGYVDRKGRIKVPLKYKTAYDYNNGLAIVKQGNQFGVINQLGVEVIRCQYEWLEPFDKYGRSKARLNGLYGIIDANGGVVVPFEYDVIGAFKDSLALVSKGLKYGYVNPEGMLVVPLELDFINGAILWGNFHEGTAKFHLKGKYGIIDQDGEKLFPAIFENVGSYSDHDYIAVKKRGKWGYSNQNLRLMIPYQFDQASSFQKGIALVQKEAGMYLINPEAEIINDSSYLEIERLGNDVFKVKNSIGWGVVDSNNAVLIDLAYAEISLYKENVLLLKKNDVLFYYNIITKAIF